jgi:hypothetical protein
MPVDILDRELGLAYAADAVEGLDHGTISGLQSIVDGSQQRLSAGEVWITAGTPPQTRPGVGLETPELDGCEGPAGGVSVTGRIDVLMDLEVIGRHSTPVGPDRIDSILLQYGRRRGSAFHVRLTSEP